jgi:hypothetical protein
MGTFILDLWAAVFAVLGKLSVFHVVRSLCKAVRQSYLFVDAWVLGNLLLALVGVVVFSFTNNVILLTVFSIYGAERVFETVVYQVNVLLFDEYRAERAGRDYAVRRFRRIIILLAHNYVEIMLWYAIFYLRFHDSFVDGATRLRISLQAIGYSFNAMTTFGYASTSPTDWHGSLLVFSEAGIGVFMAVIILARFISLIPSPKSMDESERRD